MAFSNHIFFGILILQIYVYAAPPDVSKLEEIAKVEQGASLDASTASLAASPLSLDSVPTEAEGDSDGTESQRQKRFYNPFGFGFPPINPVAYPYFNQRDDFPDVSYRGTFEVEDPLLQIQRRVQEIANFARQPQQPVPIFYPVLFVPPFDCRCNPNNPEPTSPPAPGPNNNNGSSLDFPSRLPDLADERQNWGLFINESDSNATGDGVEDDYSRPISFDPIKPSRPVRPPPPVEHGTVQSDAAGPQKPQSSNDITPPPQLTPRPVTGRPRPPPASSIRPGQTASYPPPNRGPSSPCDVAVLTCCHQPRISYDCFAAQGCPNLPSFENPCEPNAILNVIQRFQNFYASRNG